MVELALAALARFLTQLLILEKDRCEQADSRQAARIDDEVYLGIDEAAELRVRWRVEVGF